nr:hypothetical protein [Deltaproteobacteria bacterium]
MAATFQPGSGGGGGGGDEGTGGGGGGGALRVATTGALSLGATARLLANGGPGFRSACGGGASGGGSGGVVFLYAPMVTVTAGAAVSAVGGAGGVRGASNGGLGGSGGLGRIRLSATPGMCTLAGTFTPPLASACTVTPGPGTDGRVYVSAFPL